MNRCYHATSPRPSDQVLGQSWCPRPGLKQQKHSQAERRPVLVPAHCPSSQWPLVTSESPWDRAPPMGLARTGTQSSYRWNKTPDYRKATWTLL